MAGLRAYHPDGLSPTFDASHLLCLGAEESAHLVRSLRARVGEPIEVFDGRGNLWRGTVRDANPRALLMDVHAAIASSPRVPRLALAQALPKGGLMDDIVRAAVELDAAEVHPLQTARCEVRLDAPRAAARLARWRSIAVEACKQSGNPRLPAISAPVSLKTWLAALDREDAAAAASVASDSANTTTNAPEAPAASPRAATLHLVGSLEPDAVPFARLGDFPAARAAARYLMLIGPEGDLSPEEYALARTHGFRPVRFGPHTLRVPTAAHYALAVLDQLRQR